MTKYILHGGETGVPNNHNEKFYQEWVKSFHNDKTPTILLVYFSRLNETWNDLEKSDKEKFAKYTNNREAKFIIADNDMNKFIKQLQEADVVYFRGGETQKIVDTIEEIKDDLLSLIDGKIYVGSSAGVMFLSDYSMSSKGEWQKWLGLLPINSIVHYSEEKHQAILENFINQNFDSKKECILIPETEFVVREY